MVQCNEGVVVEFSPHCDLVHFVIPSHCCQLTHLNCNFQQDMVFLEFLLCLAMGNLIYE
jgi:hypothetical protein